MYMKISSQVIRELTESVLSSLPCANLSDGQTPTIHNSSIDIKIAANTVWIRRQAKLVVSKAAAGRERVELPISVPWGQAATVGQYIPNISSTLFAAKIARSKVRKCG
jgi:hypothetical protein